MGAGVERRARPASRSVGLSSQQTVRRRHQHARAAAVSSPRPRARSDFDARDQPPLSRRAGRNVHSDRIGRPGGADDSPRGVRCAPRVAGRGGGSRARARRRRRARAAGCALCGSRRARRPSVHRADRYRGRRRAQRRRAAAWTESRMARFIHRARHDGGNAARATARHRSLDALGLLRIRAGIRDSGFGIRRMLCEPQVPNPKSCRSRGTLCESRIPNPKSRRRRLRLHLPEARPCEHRRRLRALVFPERDRRCALRSAARVRRPASRTRHRRRRFGKRTFHSVPDSRGRAAARTGTRPRPDRGRCRWFRQRLHR